MFNRKSATPELDDLIIQHIAELSTLDADSPEYRTATDNLAELYKIQQNTKKDRVSKDTLAVVAGNLAGIIVIVSHERAAIITTKALNFVMKAR